MDCDVRKILGGLFVGDQQVAQNKKLLVDLGITHIIVAGLELSPKFEKDFEYLHLPVRDMKSENITLHFESSFEFIERAMSKKEGVLVHCAMGKSRSVTIVASYIMRRYGKGYNETINFIKRKRREASPNEGFKAQLRKYE